jgi:hypothetical protein
VACRLIIIIQERMSSTTADVSLLTPRVTSRGMPLFA